VAGVRGGQIEMIGRKAKLHYAQENVEGEQKEEGGNMTIDLGVLGIFY